MPTSLFKPLAALWLLIAAILFINPTIGLAFRQPDRAQLTNFDRRFERVTAAQAISPSQKEAADRLRMRLPQVQIDFEPLTGAPRMVSARELFLSGRNGVGQAISAASITAFAADDPYRALKAFLNEHRALYSHGAEILNQARVKREFVTARSGLRTTVWEEQAIGLPVFEAVLIAHTTAAGELVNVCSQFVPDPSGAAGRGASGNAAAAIIAPAIPASKAVAIAARNAGEATQDSEVSAAEEAGATPAANGQQREFQAPGLLGAATAQLVWLPMSRSELRLCWELVLTARARSEMFQIVVDAQTGEPLLRRGLTEYISDVSYRVFTNDSPTPFSPGYPTPVTNQPPSAARVLVTLPALDTNASPAGWIDDGGNETRGNNVDAHTDRDANNVPDLPRPQGSPARVFDISMNITKDPTNYSPAVVVQLFYLCNWYHDRLYQLGFTEAAGNFQSNNFGRGGFGGDAVQADAQDGSGFNNANFSAPPDGVAGRMQMYLWSGPNPRRDGDLDAEVVFHEHTHGLSNRRVGGGVGISALQTRGMGEGWSDFYALCLLSQPSDDVNGVYAFGGYATYKFGPSYLQNYYFGIRRYPYITDLSKNPLTLKDIDTVRADFCAAPAPYNAAVSGTCSGLDPSEVHNQGEVWCAVLWEARVNLVNKYGWAVGNELALQLVTDGMNLSPANPTFLQARDAIIQADAVDTGGANRLELWLAFAKRGMGFSATCPANNTTTPIHEAFDVPGELQISPNIGLETAGPPAGPFSPSCRTFLVSNPGVNPIPWSAYANQPWVSVSPASGTVAPGATNSIDVCLNAGANALSMTGYTASVVFSNTTSGVTLSRNVDLMVTPPRVLFLPLDSDPGWTRQGQWAFGKPAGLGGAGHGRSDPASGATGSNVFGINLNGDYSTALGLAANLTAGPFDFSGYSNLKLQFQRWLNSDQPPLVYAMVQVSSNGANWTSVWTNGLSETSDSSWTRVVYDISAYADNQTNVYVRWNHQVAKAGAYAYSGWNLDDIEFLGVPSTDHSVDHFAWSHIPSPQSMNVPFLVTLQALDSTDGVAAGFTGTVNLSATNAALNIAPSLSGHFVQGVWTGAVTVAQAASSVVLVADDGSGHNGLANPIAVATAPSLDLSFDGSSLALAWPAGSPTLVLETSDNLSPAVWTPVAVTPTQSGDRFVVQLPVADPQRFYRLRYTSP